MATRTLGVQLSLDSFDTTVGYLMEGMTSYSKISTSHYKGYVSHGLTLIVVLIDDDHMEPALRQRKHDAKQSAKHAWQSPKRGIIRHLWDSFHKSEPYHQVGLREGCGLHHAWCIGFAQWAAEPQHREYPTQYSSPSMTTMECAVKAVIEAPWEPSCTAMEPVKMENVANTSSPGIRDYMDYTTQLYKGKHYPTISEAMKEGSPLAN